MAHIRIREGVPGILGLFDFKPSTAKPLCDLAQTLLRGPSALSAGEREIIAAYVSGLNECRFCCSSHSAAARELPGGAPVDAARKDPACAPISPKLKALLAVAAKVQKSGRSVTAADVERARVAGASEDEIHDCVLIAAAFCMFNRYVDGLGTWAPEEPSAYVETGKRLAREGYLTAVLK